MGIPEGEERKELNLFEEIMIENLPNLAQEIDIQVQEAQRAPNKMNPKRVNTKTHHNSNAEGQRQRI